MTIDAAQRLEADVGLRKPRVAVGGDRGPEHADEAAEGNGNSGDPTARAMADETMKMPEPIMVPATSIVASVRVMARTNSVGDSVPSRSTFPAAMCFLDRCGLCAGRAAGQTDS